MPRPEPSSWLLADVRVRKAGRIDPDQGHAQTSRDASGGFGLCGGGRALRAIADRLVSRPRQHLGGEPHADFPQGLILGQQVDLEIGKNRIGVSQHGDQALLYGCGPTDPWRSAQARQGLSRGGQLLCEAGE